MTGVGLLVVALASAAPPAATAPTEGPSPDPPPPAEQSEGGVVVLGATEGDAPFEPEALKPLLESTFAGIDYDPRVESMPAGDLLARIQWAKQAAGDDVVAVYWIEAVPDGSHRLYLFDPATERLWLRGLPGGTDAGAVLESLGVILRSQTLSLSEGDFTGMQEAEAPEPEEPEEPEEPKKPQEPVVAPPPPEPPPVRVSVGLHYMGGNVGAPLVWDSGVGLRLDFELRAAVFFRLDAATNVPRRISNEPRITFGRIPIAVSAGYRFRKQADFRPEVDLGAVVEPTYWRSADVTGVAGESGRSARLAVAPGAGFVWTFWKGLGAHLHVRADVWLLNHDLVLEDDDGVTVATRLRAHPVAATLHAGLHYRF